MPQIIGSSGQTVNAVGQSTMAVHASVVRAVGALTAAAGATPLIRAAERSVYADTITLAATDGVIVGNGTVDLPTIASQDEDPQAFLISAVGGAITVVPHEDDEAIFGLDNQLVSEVTVEANTVLTLLRYVGVWRVIDSSAASLALGETSSTAYRGDRGKTAYDHSQVVTGNPHGTTAADVGADPAGTAAGLVDDLSGVSNQATARTNLGLGTAATAATGDFAAASHTHTGTQVTVDASGFNGNLTTSDDTLQEVAQKLDDLTIPAAGIADPGGSNDDFLQRKSGAWTNRTVAQVKTDLGVLGVPRTAGSYYTLGGGEAISSQTMHDTAGALKAHPVWLPAGTYDRVAMTTTVSGTSTIRVGVYPNNAATMLPDGQTLLLDCGTIDTSVTAGLLVASVSLTIPTSGVYWFATLCDARSSTPTGVGWQGGTGATPNLPWSGHVAYGNPGGRGTWGRSKTGVTTGAMPATFPAAFAADTRIPQILARAS
jgi:hypothetical protein